MAKEADSLQDGERWVTVKKNGPLHGRHLKLSKDGIILAGSVPKEFHGKHLRELVNSTNESAAPAEDSKAMKADKGEKSVRPEEQPGDVSTSHVSPSPAPKQGRKNPLDELHEDIKKHVAGQMDEGAFIEKHKGLFDRMGKRAAEKRGKEGEVEDYGQEANAAALKTLRALKSGSQKPSTDHLGHHMARRVVQGIGEALRQGNENHLSRSGSKLASIVNSVRNEHMNEKGAEPSEDELFNRVKDHHVFQSTPFAAPGTKKNIEDAREKFNAVREAMKGQGTAGSLDQKVKGKNGEDAGSVGDNIKDEGGSPEDKVIQDEEDKELKAKRSQLHDVLKQFGLSDSEAHAVRHRFGVGHAEAGFKDWDTVAKHMTQDIGKDVKPETAKKHFNNGRAKLHAHIGDERMGMLMQKSLMDDLGVVNLVYHLHMLGIYDMLMKSFEDMTDESEVPSVWIRTETSDNYGNLVKSLRPDEFFDTFTTWPDGRVTAHIHTLQRR